MRVDSEPTVHMILDNEGKEKVSRIGGRERKTHASPISFWVLTYRMVEMLTFALYGGLAENLSNGGVWTPINTDQKSEWK